MSDYPRKARQAKLNAAGFVYVSGWIKFGPVAELVAAQIENDLEEVERIGAEPARPVGYPKGRPRKRVLLADTDSPVIVRSRDEFEADLASGRAKLRCGGCGKSIQSMTCPHCGKAV